MRTKFRGTFILALVAILVVCTAGFACKNKKKMQKTDEPVTQAADTLEGGKCRLDFKTAKALSRYLAENEFKFDWVYAKANVESKIDDKEEEFDIKIKMRRDSAMLVSIQYLLGVEVAKVLITRDSVVFVNYIAKTYFKGDFNYINEMLNADLDFELLQAVLFGNSAEYNEDESKLKPVTDRLNCHYLLSTQRKRKLRKIQAGNTELRNALQILTLRPDNYKIIRNEFIDPGTNRKFIASYSNFTSPDSAFAPYRVDIEIVAQKTARIKIDYVRIEKNSPQKLSLNVPAKYDPIKLEKK